jgi:hypothetical protein
MSNTFTGWDVGSIKTANTKMKYGQILFCGEISMSKAVKMFTDELKKWKKSRVNIDTKI